MEIYTKIGIIILSHGTGKTIGWDSFIIINAE